MIKSPFNYTGGKYKLLTQIIPLFPKPINCFYDIFCGGCSVGINVCAKEVVFNDKENNLIGLLKVLYKEKLDTILQIIEEIIKSYKLSDSKTYGYEYYGCNSNSGLSSFNKIKYNRLKDDFNSRKEKDNYYYLMFYVLIVFSFNNQIRFNSKGIFNLPCGKRDFNKKMMDKLIEFVVCLKKRAVTFSSENFASMEFSNLSDKDFVYADPPYLITCATYNESNGWTNDNEIELLKLLDYLDSKGVKFALSNVLHSKNKTNEILKKWLYDNKKYKVFHLNKTYSNSNYHRDNKSNTDEILVINY